MSAYYSKYDLNTYCGTPYFLTQLPEAYTLQEVRTVLAKARAFRRLPPNLRELARLAKQWVARTHYPTRSDADRWYDPQGYELDPDTGRRLTDAEIDAQWVPDPYLDTFVVRDVPRPAGGFADPDTWEEPQQPVQEEPLHRPSKEKLLSEIESHGRKRVSETYGIPEKELPRTGLVTSVADPVELKEQFDRRADGVRQSPYFYTAPPDLGEAQESAWREQRSRDYDFLLDALEGAESYDDLGGRARTLFDAAELDRGPRRED